MKFGMKFGYTIVYVDDVTTSIEFFEKAFGFRRKFIYEPDYGELETGDTVLAFANHQLGASNLPDGYIAADQSSQPLGIEIAFVTESVAEAHQSAVAAGATALRDPMVKPWGQTVSYVRCPDGILVELCSPIRN